MKIRTGFVSNSSSSSFVLFGTKTSLPADKDYHEFYEELDREHLTFIDPESEDGIIYVGKMLHKWDECDGEIHEINAAGLEEQVLGKLERLGISCNKLKIFAGTQFN